MTFTVMGNPVGKQRPRVTMNGTFTPTKTRQYEAFVQSCWKYQSGKCFDGSKPLELSLLIEMPIPKSVSHKKKLELDGKYHTKKPDADNVIKAISDALNGACFPDDNVIAVIKAVKVYSLDPKVVVTINEIEGGYYGANGETSKANCD